MRTDAALPRLMVWLGTTHARRRHAHLGDAPGHLYQGRYKSFPVQDDEHFLIVARYIETNPPRAKLVRRAQDWRWSSVRPLADGPKIAAWPVQRPSGWLRRVNGEMTEAELSALRTSVSRGRPFGSAAWTRATAARLRLASTLAPRGRPRKPLKDLSTRQRRRRKAEERRKVGRIGG